jgi:hypothetical protein
VSSSCSATPASSREAAPASVTPEFDLELERRLEDGWFAVARIETKRHVVPEDPLAHGPDVDAALRAFERSQGADRVGWVEGDGGNWSERAVPAGHPEDFGPDSAASVATAAASSPSRRTWTSLPRRSASRRTSSTDGRPFPERGLTSRKLREALGLDGAFDGVHRPGRPDAHEMAVRVRQVVDLRPEAGPRDRATPDPMRLEPLDLLVELLRSEL